MIETGLELRKKREELGISQARLSELTGLSQHILSAFELGKTDLKEDALRGINDIFPNISNFEHVLKRKKRYRTHSYAETFSDPERPENARPTVGNPEFLSELRSLEYETDKKFTAVSFFSGVGGFSLGFRSQGFEVKGFAEIDNGLAKIYQSNFPDAERLGDDITKISTNSLIEFRERIGEVDVVIGGPPCQGFSLSGKRDMDDPRNYLFQDYLRVIDIIKPKFAIIENVRLLTSMKAKDGSYFKDSIQNGLKGHGYRAKLFEINAKNYGVPQHRERVIFIAVRNDLNIEPTFPAASFSEQSDLLGQTLPCRTFGDACSDLAYLESGQADDVDTFHKAVKHPDHVLKWLWDVPQGFSAHDNEDPALRPPSGYNTTYKRQIWTEPASTVQTTFGMISGCRNVHPIATRSLTIREACRLQTFPDNFKLEGSLGTIRTGIGNAVPPLLAQSLAKQIAASLSNLVKVSSL
jgi:DNA (cytosine-5)-methyltransferase 1